MTLLSHQPTRIGARPRRLVFVLEGLALGGCPINAIDLARTLRARNHVVHLVAVDEDVLVSILPYARQAGFDVFLLPAEAGVVGRALQIQRYAREHDLDVIHAFAPWLARSAVLAVGASRRRVCVVQNWTMDNVYPVSRRTTLVLGTAGLRDEALAARGGSVCLLEPPVDLTHDRPDPAAGERFRRDHGIERDDIVVSLVGRVDRSMKLSGILLAIEVVARSTDRRLRLVVVGDGDAMEEVRARASEVNRALGREAVVLAGHMADPHPAYAAADIGFAMGGSAIRVLAHGLPLIVLGEQGFSRLFAPHTEDYFFSAGFYGDGGCPSPVDNLAEQLSLLEEPDTRRRLGERGLTLAHERYGLEAAADRLEEIYADATDQAPPPLVAAYDMTLLAGRTYVGIVRRSALRLLRGGAS